MSSLFKKSKSSPFDPWKDPKIASAENEILLRRLNKMEGRKLIGSNVKEFRSLELFRGVKGDNKGKGKVPSYQENLNQLNNLIKLREEYEKKHGRNPTTATKFEQLDLAIALHKEVVQNIKNRSDRVLLEDQSAEIKKIDDIYEKAIASCNMNIGILRSGYNTPGLPEARKEEYKKDISEQEKGISRFESERDAEIEKLKQRYAAAEEVSSMHSNAQKSGIDIEPTSKEKNMVGTYRARYYQDRFRTDKPPEATRGLPIVKAAAAPAAATATTAGASAAPAAAAAVPPVAVAAAIVPPAAAATVAPAPAPPAASPAPAAVPGAATPAVAATVAPAAPAKPIAPPVDPKVTVAPSAAPAAATLTAPRKSLELTDEPQKTDTSLVIESEREGPGPDTSLNISTQGAGPRAKVAAAGEDLSLEAEAKGKEEEQKPEGEGDAEKTLGVEKERKKISKSGKISWKQLIKEIGKLFEVLQEVGGILKGYANMRFDKRNVEKAKN